MWRLKFTTTCHCIYISNKRTCPVKKVLEVSQNIKKKKITIFVNILVMCKSCGLRICCCISSAKNINITMEKFENNRY